MEGDMKDKKNKQFFSVRVTEEEYDNIMRFNKKKFQQDRDWTLSKFCRIAWEKFIKGE
jgi:hypothetical protein